MKQCPKCHQQYNSEQNFCPTDGAALVALDVAEKIQVIQPNVPPAAAPVQIIQMPAAKSKTGLYIVLALLAAVAMAIAFFVWQKKVQEKEQKAMEKQAQQEQAEYERDNAARVAAAKLADGTIKNAIDGVAEGEAAAYRACAETKMSLYQKRYNVWVEWQDNVPTKAHSQQNASLAAQSSINSCRKEAEALTMGVPSFDCGKATSPTELAICTNKELAQLDVTLSNASRSARFFASDIDKFSNFMKTWIKNRNNCADNVDCISGIYKSAISTLNSQVEP